MAETTNVIRERFIQAFPAFKSAGEQFISDILSSARLESFSTGRMIYLQGDACSHIALLLSGEIRVYKMSELGREITLYEIGPGDTCILNASCILSDITYPANAATVEAGEMLLLPAARFRELLARHEEMRTFVFSLLSQRLGTVMALVEEVAFGKLDERLSEYLLEKAGDGQLATTHQKIANDLGTSREVVSRLLKDFERQGRIRLSRNLIHMVNL